MLREGFIRGRLVTVLLIAASAVLASGAGNPAEKHLPVLTTTFAVHNLSSEEADRGYPVYVRAVVTIFQPKWNVLYVSDASGGIFVNTDLKTVTVRPGQILDIEGISSKGAFAPTIVLSRYRLIGEGRMPPAQHVNFERLSAGSTASQYVEVDGIVRSATLSEGMLNIRLAMGTGVIHVSSPSPSGASFDYLVDAEVRVRGVAGQNFNDKRQMTGPKLAMRNIGDLRIIRPAPAGVWSLPVRQIDRLAGYSATGVIGHRVHVRGVVTLHWPGKMLVVKDSTQSVVVKSAERLPLHVGDLADVVGFPGNFGYSPALDAALFRRLGAGQAASPQKVGPKQAGAGKLDAELVMLDGEVLHLNRRNGEFSLVLSSGGYTYEAVLNKTARAEGLAEVPIGSRVRVTGVCLVDVDAEGKPMDFRILMRSPEDVTVVLAPSWWTLGKLFYALGALGVLSFVVVVWVILLRRRVRKQTALIRTQLAQAEQLKEIAALGEARFQAFMDHTPLVGVMKDRSGRMIYVNRRFTQEFRREPEQCLGITDRDLWPEPVAQELRRNDLQVLESGKSAEFLETTPGPGERGTTWLSLKFPFRQGSSTYIGSMALDITDRERDKEALRISELRFQSLFSCATLGIAISDCEGQVTRVNPAFCRVLRTSEEECLNSSVQSLVMSRPDLAGAGLRELAERGTTFESRHTRNGGDMWIESCLFAVPDPRGGVMNLVLMVEDITQRKSAEAQMGFEARHDPLTGLANRRGHDEYLRERIEVASLTGSTFCVLYVDLDDFKIVNDTMGHAAGDLVLREAASRLSSLARDGGFLARVGGDEFVLVADVDTRQSAIAIASRLRDEMEKPFRMNGRYVELRASAGFSMYPDDGTDPETLSRKADQSMYSAKNLGKLGREFGRSSEQSVSEEAERVC